MDQTQADAELRVLDEDDELMMADAAQLVAGRQDWDLDAVKVWIAQLRVGALVVTADGWDGWITEAGDGT